MRDLSQVTSPPFLSVRMIESPSTRCPFTEMVRFEVRITISARADVVSPSVAMITVKVTKHNLNCIWNGVSYHPGQRPVQKRYRRACWQALGTSPALSGQDAGYFTST